MMMLGLTVKGWPWWCLYDVNVIAAQSSFRSTWQTHFTTILNLYKPFSKFKKLHNNYNMDIYRWDFSCGSTLKHQSCPSFSMIPVGAAFIYGIPLYISTKYRAGIFHELWNFMRQLAQQQPGMVLVKGSESCWVSWEVQVRWTGILRFQPATKIKNKNNNWWMLFLYKQSF